MQAGRGIGRPEETLDPPDWASRCSTLAPHRRRCGRLLARRPRAAGLAGDAGGGGGARSGRRCPIARRRWPTSTARCADNVMSYPMGNIHPRFWSWYMGSSNFTGALGDFLAAIQGSNLGGGNHAAALMDQQVVDWCKEMLGFPAIGQRHAGQRRLDGQPHRPDRGAQRQGRHRRARARRRRARSRLRFYGSDQIHSCHRKAMEALGLGNRALRRIPTDSGCASTSRPCGRRSPRIARAASGRPASSALPARSTPGAIDDLAALAEHRRRGRPVVPCRRLHRRADRDRAAERLSRRRHRTGGFGRARSAQMAARAVRGRLRPGPGPARTAAPSR